MKLAALLLALSALAADTPDPAISDAEHIELLEAQLASEQADHAIDKAKLDYLQASPAKEKASADMQKLYERVLAAHGCSSVEIEKRVCRIEMKDKKLAVSRQLSAVSPR